MQDWEIFLAFRKDAATLPLSLGFPPDTPFNIVFLTGTVGPWTQLVKALGGEGRAIVMLDTINPSHVLNVKRSPNTQVPPLLSS